jgi:hypothetical protein
MLHEHAAGMGLCPEFFEISGIDPDAPVTCNCNFDEGHEPNCHIVAAHFLSEFLDRLETSKPIAGKGPIPSGLARSDEA